MTDQTTAITKIIESSSDDFQSSSTLQQHGVDRMLVRLEHLDKLLNLAGEVIITSSTLHELQRDMTDAVTHNRPMSEIELQIIKSADEASARISQDLHDLVMAIRMVEIGETFKLFRRPVRDLARNLKKDIELKFEGGKVLVDKALAERLVEPLLHLLRNAADHGLETPIERSHANKKELGIILLKAVEHEHETEIVVSDDGRGIDEQKIFERAVKLGLIKPSDPQQDLLSILCMSGFSTKEKATNTSGRGVGLDLVNTMVQEFSGTLEFENNLGTGCTFRLHIPKLKAVNIIDALIVRCTNTLYALSIDKVVSLQGIKPAQIQASMDRERFIKYLGEPLALFDLSELLGSEPSKIDNPEIIPVVIIEGRKDKVACIVTEFLAPSKLVNVPLATDMFERNVTGIAGTCIISGGRVGITVDIDMVVAIATGEPLKNDEGHANASDFSQPKELELENIADNSIPESASMFHSQEELIAKSKLSVQRDRIANRIEESSQKELTDTDISDLLTELSRGLLELQDALLSMENNNDPEIMKDAFRRLHAAKGNFTMLGVTTSASLAHELETLLDHLRKGDINITQELMDLMLDGVAELINATNALPQRIFEPNTSLLSRIDIVKRAITDTSPITDPDKVLGTSFTLVPTVELQLLSSLKQKGSAYETFIRFHPSRQASFLVAYLTLRKLCYHGTILATLPSIADIENGFCSNAIKILWASSLTLSEIDESINKWAQFFNIAEHKSIPTTVFRYDNNAEI
ncbi:MAG: Hpt domain-containing protein [Planctomycetaceae bacterium]|jgi:chemotaxis protein histidine kinase CheA|nr:Hpt domain-containing protein [Planctomycetaceae bacterium]